MNTAKTSGKTDPAPLSNMLGGNYPYHFLAGAQSAMPFDSMGNPWNGSYVTATGNLKMACELAALNRRVAWARAA